MLFVLCIYVILHSHLVLFFVYVSANSRLPINLISVLDFIALSTDSINLQLVRTVEDRISRVLRTMRALQIALLNQFCQIAFCTWPMHSTKSVEEPNIAVETICEKFV